MEMFIPRATHVHATTMLGPKPYRGTSDILAQELRSRCTEGKTITECTDRNARDLNTLLLEKGILCGPVCAVSVVKVIGPHPKPDSSPTNAWVHLSCTVNGSIKDNDSMNIQLIFNLLSCN